MGVYYYSIIHPHTHTYPRETRTRPSAAVSKKSTRSRTNDRITESYIPSIAIQAKTSWREHFRSPFSFSPQACSLCLSGQINLRPSERKLYRMCCCVWEREIRGGGKCKRTEYELRAWTERILRGISNGREREYFFFFILADNIGLTARACARTLSEITTAYTRTILLLVVSVRRRAKFFLSLKSELLIMLTMWFKIMNRLKNCLNIIRRSKQT